MGRSLCEAAGGRPEHTEAGRPKSGEEAGRIGGPEGAARKNGGGSAGKAMDMTTGGLAAAIP
eukprot:12166032-Heterocapsa_arctica.AAC.1